MKRKKIKDTKAERKIAREKEMELFLKRMGYKGGPKESIHKIPDYRTNNYNITSNQIPGNGAKIRQNIYSGDELLGLSTMHKSNTVPIRKDNKQAAIDAAQMRRN
jgi:hypothetical protein